MKRSAFLQTTAAGVTASAACAPPGEEAPSDDEVQDAAPAFEFDEVPVPDLQQMMESGEHSAHSIAEACIARIEALDRRGPGLRRPVRAHGWRQDRRLDHAPSSRNGIVGSSRR